MVRLYRARDDGAFAIYTHLAYKNHQTGRAKSLMCSPTVSRPFEFVLRPKRCRDSAAVCVLNDFQEPRQIPKYPEVVQELAFCGFGCGLGISVIKFDAVRNFDSRLRACRIAGRENQHEKQ